MSQSIAPQTLSFLGMSPKAIDEIPTRFDPPKAERGDDITNTSSLRQIEGLMILAKRQPESVSETVFRNQLYGLQEIIKDNLMREAERSSVPQPSEEALESASLGHLHGLVVRAIGTVKAIQDEPLKLAHRHERECAIHAAQNVVRGSHVSK